MVFVISAPGPVFDVGTEFFREFFQCVLESFVDDLLHRFVIARCDGPIPDSKDGAYAGFHAIFFEHLFVHVFKPYAKDRRRELLAMSMFVPLLQNANCFGCLFAFASGMFGEPCEHLGEREYSVGAEDVKLDIFDTVEGVSWELFDTCFDPFGSVSTRKGVICKVRESRGKDSVVGGRDEPSLWVVERGAVLVIEVPVPLLRWILGICEATLSSLAFGNQADLSVSNISLLVGKNEVPTGCAPEFKPFIDLSGIFGAHDAKSGFKGGAFDVICAPPEQQLFTFGTFDWEDRAELCAFECLPEDGDVYRCFFEPDNRAKGGDVDLLFA